MQGLGKQLSPVGKMPEAENLTSAGITLAHVNSFGPRAYVIGRGYSPIFFFYG